MNQKKKIKWIHWLNTFYSNLNRNSCSIEILDLIESTNAVGSLTIQRFKMAKKKAFIPFFYFTSIIFLPWLISLCCNKSLKIWITNWWNTRQCETFFNDIQEKSVLEKFIQLEDLFQLDEMIKEYPETDLQQFRLGIHKETIQFIKIHNEYHIHTILHFSTNLISFVILSGYSFWGKEKLFILNSWVQEFLYNLSDTIKAFSILLLTDLCIGFHSPHGWELMIGYIYKDFGFAHYEQILSGLVSTFPVILDTIFKYWIFRYLNRVSPSLVVIYHAIND